VDERILKAVERKSRARTKAAGPAIGLIIVGILNALIGLAYAADLAFSGRDDEVGPFDAPADAELPELLDFLNEPIPPPTPSDYLMAAAMFAVGAFIVYGGLCMKGLQSHGLAIASSILAMIPVLSPTSCCLAGIGVGIWSLVILSNQEVRDAFE